MNIYTLIFLLTLFILFLCTIHKINISPTNFISLSTYPEMNILVENYSKILRELEYVLENSLWTRYDILHKKNIFQKSDNKTIQQELKNNISKINKNTTQPEWKIYGLLLNKERIKEHTKICPFTTQLLESIPYVINAGFSCLEAGKITDYHSDDNINFYRYQLPLIVPYGDTKFRSIDEIIKYEPNKPFIFDDSKMHQAWNLTDKIRIVLIIDILKKN
jgi:hypothetical protein